MQVIKLFDIPEEIINDNERQRRVYSTQGISPTILGRSDSVKIMEVKQIGNIMPNNNRDNPNQGRVYDQYGLSPTLTDMQGGGRQPMIIDEVKRIGNLSETKSQSRTVYDADGISPTLCSGMDHGNTMPHVLENIPCKLDKMPEGSLTSINDSKICDVGTETASTITARYHKGIGAHKDNMCIVAMRGRNPENPSDRTVGSPTEQRLEPNSQGICNTLTSVQKDNLVMEKVCYIDEQNMNARNDVVWTLTTDGSSPKHNNRVLETVRIKQATKEGYIECKVGGVADLLYPSSTTRRGRVQDNGDVSPTITSMENGLYKIESQYRIRKLTPRECWRLMDFSDADFDKAAEVNSNTQLYKQAGNSIVKNVLIAIFGQMIPGKENIYKEINRKECEKWENQ